MWEPGQSGNPGGKSTDTTTENLRKAVDRACKAKRTSLWDEIAKLFMKSDKYKMALLPYLAPKLRTLEVSGQVSAPFQFIIERSSGETVNLPAANTKRIESKIVMSPIKNDKRSAAGRKAVKIKSKPTKRKPVARAKRKHTNDK